MDVKEGVKAPVISLPDQNGKVVSLSDLLGQWVLVYFYPKDDTPGCTKEACSLQENLKTFETLKLKVIGISPDSVKSHRKFADKFSLTFPLLADEEKSVVQACGIWVQKKFMGREYMGVARSSFLVAPDGTVANVYPKVDPEGHAAEVLKDVQALC